jgi:MFS transporter, MHS family, proline/betaine transporter
LAQMIFVLIFCNIESAIPATLAEMFPAAMRCSGVAIGYNLTLGVIGGTAPMVSTWLVEATGDIAAPAYYLMALALISFVAALRIKSSRGRQPTQEPHQ